LDIILLLSKRKKSGLIREHLQNFHPNRFKHINDSATHALTIEWAVNYVLLYKQEQQNLEKVTNHALFRQNHELHVFQRAQVFQPCKVNALAHFLLFCIDRRIAFDAISSPFLHDFVNSVRGDTSLVLGARDSLRTWVLSGVFAQIQKMVMQSFLETSVFSFTSDLWTTKSKKKHFIGVTVHWCDVNGKSHSLAVELLPFKFNANAVEIASSIRNVFQTICDPKQLIFCGTSDTEAAMRNAISYVLNQYDSLSSFIIPEDSQIIDEDDEFSNDFFDCENDTETTSICEFEIETQQLCFCHILSLILVTVIGF
jgi:hypothetical protein